MEQSDQDEPPGGPSQLHRKHKNFSFKKLSVKASPLPTGLKIDLNPSLNFSNLELHYPQHIWANFPNANKFQLIDSLTFTFTAHIPLLFNHIQNLCYSTSHPLVHSWINSLFLKFLPTYWYLYKKSPEADTIQILQKILNSNYEFTPKLTSNPTSHPKTSNENVIIPFTFGKDSLLSYLTAKSIGLNPTLIYFFEPTEKYSKKHKLNLIQKFENEHNEQIHFIDNNLAALRAPDDEWFGWETTLTTYALMSLPFAHHTKSQYIIFSNETSCNDFFFSKDNLKVMFDYEQSSLATNDLSLLTQALTNQQVNCGNFLAGLYEIAIIAILKEEFRPYIEFLMSCWAETAGATHHRWCQECSKCARIFVFLAANNIDPIKEAGFTDNLFQSKYLDLFTLFSTNHKNVTYDSLGMGRQEQLLAFYLAAKNGFKGELINKFKSSGLFKEADQQIPELINKYFSLKHAAQNSNPWQNQINDIYNNALSKARSSITINQNHEHCLSI